MSNNAPERYPEMNTLRTVWQQSENNVRFSCDAYIISCAFRATQNTSKRAKRKAAERWKLTKILSNALQPISIRRIFNAFQFSKTARMRRCCFVGVFLQSADIMNVGRFLRAKNGLLRCFITFQNGHFCDKNRQKPSGLCVWNDNIVALRGVIISRPFNE